MIFYKINHNIDDYYASVLEMVQNEAVKEKGEGEGKNPRIRKSTFSEEKKSKETIEIEKETENEKLNYKTNDVKEVDDPLDGREERAAYILAGN